MKNFPIVFINNKQHQIIDYNVSGRWFTIEVELNSYEDFLSYNNLITPYFYIDSCGFFEGCKITESVFIDDSDIIIIEFRFENLIKITNEDKYILYKLNNEFLFTHK